MAPRVRRIPCQGVLLALVVWWGSSPVSRVFGAGDSWVAGAPRVCSSSDDDAVGLGDPLSYLSRRRQALEDGRVLQVFVGKDRTTLCGADEEGAFLWAAGSPREDDAELQPQAVWTTSSGRVVVLRQTALGGVDVEVWSLETGTLQGRTRVPQFCHGAPGDMAPQDRLRRPVVPHPEGWWRQLRVGDRVDLRRGIRYMGAVVVGVGHGRLEIGMVEEEIEGVASVVIEPESHDESLAPYRSHSASWDQRLRAGDYVEAQTTEGWKPVRIDQVLHAGNPENPHGTTLVQVSDQWFSVLEAMAACGTHSAGSDTPRALVARDDFIVVMLQRLPGLSPVLWGLRTEDLETVAAVPLDGTLAAVPGLALSPQGDIPSMVFAQTQSVLGESLLSAVDLGSGCLRWSKHLATWQYPKEHTLSTSSPASPPLSAMGLSSGHLLIWLPREMQLVLVDQDGGAVLLPTEDGLAVPHAVLLDVPQRTQHEGTCGLAALAMVHRYYSLQEGRRPRPSERQVLVGDELAAASSLTLAVLGKTSAGAVLPRSSLLELAKTRGYSVLGEMFNISQLADLASLEDVGLRATVLRSPTPHQVVDLLKAGVPLIVPFDVGMDGEPTVVGGEHAHYAVLVGFFNCSEHPACGGENDLVLFARHAWNVKPLHLWSFRQLQASSRQLESTSFYGRPGDGQVPRSTYTKGRSDLREPKCMALPPKGPGSNRALTRESLADQILVVTRRQSQERNK